MISIRKTKEKDVSLIVDCLENKFEEFIGQCGYGKRFFTTPITLEQILNFQKNRNEESLFITILNDDIIIGSLELILHKNEERGGIARFLIYDDYRFKGYGTDTLKILTDYAFNKLYLKKLTLGVFTFNESALKCYKKAGFIETNRVKIDDWDRIDMEIVNSVS